MPLFLIFTPGTYIADGFTYASGCIFPFLLEHHFLLFCFLQLLTQFIDLLLEGSKDFVAPLKGSLEVLKLLRVIADLK